MSNSVAIEVTRKGEGWVAEVEVTDGRQTTLHTVAVSTADLARWGRGDGDPEVADLVRRSFDFLLRREPATSILRRFELSVIQRYFPEYDEQFARHKKP
jgi:hypothetical protein